MIEHVYNLGNQLTEDLTISPNFEPPSYENLLIVGMGGSGVAGDILKLVLNQNSSINVEIKKTYGIPKHIIQNKPKCLFLSYSGNTEETISAVKIAIENNLDWYAVSSGGTLLELAKENNKEFIQVPQGLQPRAALGYMAQAVLHFLPESVDFDLEDECRKVQELIENLLLEKENNETLSLAKNIAIKLSSKSTVIYGGTELSYLAAQRWKTQINENAKSKAFVGFMPEIHHNEILSWEANKEESKNNYQIIFLRDPDEDRQIDKRFELTEKIIGNDVEIIEVKNINSDSSLMKLFYLIFIGDLVSVFMADHLLIDPYDIANIEALKKMLKEV